jgi:hypothetical protein
VYYFLQGLRVLAAYLIVEFPFIAMQIKLIEAGVMDDLLPMLLEFPIIGLVFWSLGFPLRRFTRAFALWSPREYGRCVRITAMLTVLGILSAIGNAIGEGSHACDYSENWSPRVCP